MRSATIRIIFIISALMLLPALIFSQTLKNEIGIQTRSFKNFGLTFSKQQTENRFVRYRLAYLNFNYAERGREESQANVGIGIAIGKENRKSINKNCSFIHGWEPRLNIGYNNQNNFYQINLGTGLGYILGVNYKVVKDLHLRIDLIPSIAANFQTNNEGRRDFNVSGSFNSSNLTLNLVYSFNKQQQKLFSVN